MKVNAFEIINHNYEKSLFTVQPACIRIFYILPQGEKASSMDELES